MSLTTSPAVAAGGTMFKFTVGTAGASEANTVYISREQAVHLSRGGSELSVADERARGEARIQYIGRSGAAGPGEARPGVALLNMPQPVRDARTYDEMRRELATYAAHRAEAEVQRHGNRAGRPRTHYRAIGSYEEKVPTEVARADAEEWAKRAVPDARVAIFVHQDTDHTHVHIWIDARLLDGSKLHLGHAQYRSLDEVWNEIYSQTMRRDPAEHLRKKQQAKAFKQALWKGEAGPENRPERVAPSGPDAYQERDRRRQRQEAAGKGEQSFPAYVRKHAAADFREAKSLEELNERLKSKGLKIVSKGRGGVVRTLDETEEAKLSTVGRELSWGKLHAAFEERRAEAERRRKMGASLVGRLRRQRRFGQLQQSAGQETEGVTAALARRAEAARLAGQDYHAAIALSRSRRREEEEGLSSKDGEHGQAAGGDGRSAPVDLEQPAPDSIFHVDRSAEEENEKPTPEESEGAAWVGGVLAGRGDFSEYDIEEQTYESTGQHQEEPSGPPKEAEIEEESSSELPAGAARDAEGETTLSEEAGASRPEEPPSVRPGRGRAVAEAAAAEAAGADGQNASEKDGGSEIDEVVALGQRLHHLLSEIVKQQKEEAKREALADLGAKARTLEAEFARRASLLTYETLRSHQFPQAERALLDACKSARERQKGGANRGEPKPKEPESQKTSAASSQGGAPGRARRDAVEDVARQLAGHVRKIIALDRAGKATSDQRAELAEEARKLKKRFVQAATEDEKSALARSLSDEERQLVKRNFAREPSAKAKEGASKATEKAPAKTSEEEKEGAQKSSKDSWEQLRALLRRIPSTRGMVQREYRQRARHIIRNLAGRSPKAEWRWFRGTLPEKSEVVLDGITEEVRAQNRSGRAKSAAAEKEAIEKRAAGQGSSSHMDEKPSERIRAMRSVQKQLKERLHALQVLIARVEATRATETLEEKKEAAMALQKARKRFGSRKTVARQIIELAGRFAEQADETEQRGFEASLPDEASRERFRTAVQKSKTTEQQRDAPENDAGRDPGENFEVE